ncbi:MAG: DNA methyltransferase [Desulfobaccales bacterium]
MTEVEDASIDLVVTSPPYWHIKDYGVPGQIGYGQSLHEYLKDLYRTWRECFRVLREGARLCINIGDQFARAAVYGRYKVIPLHAEFINQCEHMGFDFLGAIIWQKKTTMNTTGGAVVMGSYPFPPNGIVEIDYEFIQIFKKPGKSKKVAKEIKAASRLTKEEWKEYFAGHWHFGGVRQAGHEAMFPQELPRRLIKMFTFVGDTVLDPFLGSGTTVKVAIDLGRQGIGYEINDSFVGLIEEKLGVKNKLPIFSDNIEIINRDTKIINLLTIDYNPIIQDANPIIQYCEEDYKNDNLSKVIEIINKDTIRIDNGNLIKFLGINVNRSQETIDYLNKQLLGKKVILKDQIGYQNNNITLAYIYLKNKIFINTYLIKAGLANADISINHRFANKFIKLGRERENA